ncbi:NUDIX domain-containing protein [Microbacterium sp. YY-01]|uniref:NUDIX domain-containing protein n=1 Tax=Microbacterium sp. YY-01 TaxID=3421634 RepID=UPI003D1760AD
MLLRDEPAAVEVVSSELLFEGAIWNVRSDRFVFGGEELERQYVEHPGAVAVVAVDDQRRVLLIQQYRHPIGHRDWELPAGLLDVRGEEPFSAVQRELAEEADLRAERWEPLVETWTTPGGNSELIRIYLATGITAAEEAFTREAEEADIRLQWVDLAEAAAAAARGDVRNAILMIGVMAADRRVNGA